MVACMARRTPLPTLRLLPLEMPKNAGSARNMQFEQAFKQAHNCIKSWSGSSVRLQTKAKFSSAG
jgi:hypothetical protein